MAELWALNRLTLENLSICLNDHRANKACTRLVGLAAFSGSFLGSKLVPSKWRCLVLPTSG